MLERQALTHFKVYSDSLPPVFYGLVDVQLPDVSMQVADIKGAGISGTISSPLKGVFESMRLTLNWRSLDPSATELMAHKQHNLLIMGNVQAYDNILGAYIDSSVKILASGTPVKSAGGKLSVGEAMGGSTELEITKYQYFIDSIPQVKIDKLNNIYEINGTDQLKSVRTNIGDV